MTPVNPKILILASKSPRRKELLENAGIRLKIHPSGINEETVRFETPEEYVTNLSVLKANDVAAVFPDDWVLAADTIVVSQDRVLEKPRSGEDARRMLKLLSGSEHLVYTGFCLINQQLDYVFRKAVQTRVSFKPLTDAEINWYVDTGEPFDKAGAYGIQGIGAFLVKQISGSYTNVVGLPVCEVMDLLIRLNIVKL